MIAVSGNRSKRYRCTILSTIFQSGQRSSFTPPSVLKCSVWSVCSVHKRILVLRFGNSQSQWHANISCLGPLTVFGAKAGMQEVQLLRLFRIARLARAARRHISVDCFASNIFRHVDTISHVVHRVVCCFFLYNPLQPRSANEPCSLMFFAACRIVHMSPELRAMMNGVISALTTVFWGFLGRKCH